VFSFSPPNVFCTSSSLNDILDILPSFILYDENELASINISPSSAFLTTIAEFSSDLALSITLSIKSLLTIPSVANLSKLLNGNLSNSG